MLTVRNERTLAHVAEVTGFGFVFGADVHVRCRPAEAGHGIVFQRVDLPGKPTVSARVENTIPRQRRTAIRQGDALVEMTEHLMAALAGLQIDNCLVELNAPELPGLDGSSRIFADALMTAGIQDLGVPRKLFSIGQRMTARHEGDNGNIGNAEVTAAPVARRSLVITYELDYGPRSPIHPQEMTVEITPSTFLNELAYARTFILDSEAEAMKAAGMGSRVTEKDLLIFGAEGPIGNSLRARDECVRHKILDCLGDFALMGCDLHGHFHAYRSGHRLNQRIIQLIKEGDATGNADNASFAA